MVSLMTSIGDGKYASCGASLINDRYILTAAHCLAFANKSEDVIVTLFAHTTQDRIKLPKLKVESLIKNPFWGKEGYGNHHDISLVKLAERQVFSQSFSPICLPGKNSSWLEHRFMKKKMTEENATHLIEAPDGNITTLTPLSASASPDTRSPIDSAFVTGWGHQNKFGFKVKASALFEADTEVYEESVCESSWRANYDPKYEICAGTAACQGDSGGPLAVRVDGVVTQIGVVSYGPSTCNIPFYLGPTVYERISSHWDFIQENTRDAIWCRP